MNRRSSDPADRLRAALLEHDGTPDEPAPDAGDVAADEPGDEAAAAHSAPAGPGHAALTRARRDPGAPAWVSWPVGMRDRFSALSHPVLLGFLVLAVVAGLLFGLRVVRARAEATPVPMLPTSTAVVSIGSAQPPGQDPGTVPAAAGSGSGSGGGGSPGASATGEVVVHVVGQVRKPGLVRLTPGARVQEAVSAAGGATGRADLAAVNLARPVVDGEQIRIPKPGETTVSPPAAPTTSVGGGTGGGEKVNINTADASALDTLPGVGPVLAQRILDWRAEHGRFSSVDELGEVSGIGEKLLAQLGPLVVL